MTDAANDERVAAGVTPAGGGDAACWLAQVCEECGALVEGARGTPCWRCGSAWQIDDA